MAGQNVTVKINGVKKEYPQGPRFLERAKEYNDNKARDDMTVLAIGIWKK